MNLDIPAPAAAPERPDGDHSRRAFLRRAGLAGSTALVVSAGGLSYRAYDQGVFEAGEGGAYDAWSEWRQGRGPLALVSAAVLAANPHNSQAWVFRSTASRIDLFADRRRSTGSLDPFDRELYVGLGCALENLLQAAPAHGYPARLTLLPTPRAGRSTPGVSTSPRDRAAVPRFSRPSPSATPTAAPTGRRRFRRRSGARMAALAGGLGSARLRWFTNEADRARIGALMSDAAQAIVGDERQSRDNFKLFRPSWMTSSATRTA